MSEEIVNVDDKPKMSRAESLAAARAAKALKRESGAYDPPAKTVSSAKLAFWEKAFLTIAQNFAVRSSQGLDACRPIADRAVEIWEAKREEYK